MTATEKVFQLHKIQNGIVTLKNSTTGDHRTFRIYTQSNDANFAPGKRILSLLSGPDNCNNYRGFAFVDNQEVKVWSKLRSKNAKPSAHEIYADMIAVKLAKTPSKFANHRYENYSVLFVAHCLICNRILTTPESIQRGIGPYCAGRI